MITNKMKTVQLKMREARFWPKMKFEPIFFQVLWQFFNPKGSLLRAGGRGVWGEFRPALSFPLSLFSLALEVVPTSLARRPICFYFTCFIGILESLRNLVKVLFSVPLLLPECRCCPVLLLQ